MPNLIGVADHAAPTDLADERTVEPKVRAATAAGASSAGVLVPFVLWLLATFVFHGVVPVPVESAVGLIVTGACTFAAGYYARHVDRVRTEA